MEPARRARCPPVGIFARWLDSIATSLDQRLTGERRLNELLDSFLRSGYDELQAVQIVVSAAQEPNWRISGEGLQRFLAQPRVTAIIADHRDEPWVRRTFPDLGD